MDRWIQISVSIKVQEKALVIAAIKDTRAEWVKRQRKEGRTKSRCRLEVIVIFAVKLVSDSTSHDHHVTSKY